MKKKIIFIFVFAIIAKINSEQDHENRRTFVVDYEKGSFLKDGKFYRLNFLLNKLFFFSKFFLKFFSNFPGTFLAQFIHTKYQFTYGKIDLSS